VILIDGALRMSHRPVIVKHSHVIAKEGQVFMKKTCPDRLENTYFGSKWHLRDLCYTIKVYIYSGTQDHEESGSVICSAGK
jgi:hypothetical protein